MNQFIIKLFLRKFAIKAVFFTDHHKLLIRWFVPKGNQFTYEGKMFNLDKNNFFIHKGTISYAYLLSDPTAINPFDSKRSAITSEEFHDALASKVIKDIVATTDKRLDPGILLMIFGFVTIGVIAVVAYLGSEQLSSIMALLREIREALRLVGGI